MTEIVYSAIDPSSKATKCFLAITAIDNEPPRILGFPGDDSQEYTYLLNVSENSESGTIADLPALVATDNVKSLRSVFYHQRM